MKPLLLWLFVTFYVAFQISAQQGDASDPAGEKQLERLPAHAIPSAPVLSPDKALKSFRLQPGLRMELVAAEPLIHDPVMMAFDPMGRIWVVEMSGYMPNPEGNSRVCVFPKKTTLMERYFQIPVRRHESLSNKQTVFDPT
jgi:hypothetical protein